MTHVTRRAGSPDVAAPRIEITEELLERRLSELADSLGRVRAVYDVTYDDGGSPFIQCTHREASVTQTWQVWPLPAGGSCAS